MIPKWKLEFLNEAFLASLQNGVEPVQVVSHEADVVVTSVTLISHLARQAYLWTEINITLFTGFGTFTFGNEYLPSEDEKVGHSQAKQDGTYNRLCQELSGEVKVLFELLARADNNITLRVEGVGGENIIIQFPAALN